jgi:hypothetical protein
LVSPGSTGDDTIVISRAAVADMAAQHEKLWGRAPTPEEMQGLVRSRVHDEILYREGRAMGLDQDDAVIKRRVRQKYELIAEEEDSAAPTEAELVTYLKANPDRFRAPPVVGFTQIIVPLDGTDAEIEARIATLKSALANGASPDALGGTSLLPARMAATPLDLVARDFGSRFAEALATAPLGQWAGPFPSAYGMHLVRLDGRTPSAVPPLAEIRGQVSREWENDRRQKARTARLAELRKRYTIVVEDAGAADAAR